MEDELALNPYEHIQAGGETTAYLLIDPEKRYKNLNDLRNDFKFCESFAEIISGILKVGENRKDFRELFPKDKSQRDMRIQSDLDDPDLEKLKKARELFRNPSDIEQDFWQNILETKGYELNLIEQVEHKDIVELLIRNLSEESLTEVERFIQERQGEVVSIRKTADGNYGVTYNEGEQSLTLLTDIILSTIPAYTAAELFGHFEDGIKKHLNAVYYPPVLVLYLAYNKDDIGQPLDGFGFLIPSKEEKSFLGAIWSSVIFPNRAEDNMASFTLFIGGSRNPGFIYDDEEELIKTVRQEFEELMKINGEPVHLAKRFWEKAIPQYTIGYVEHENYFDHFEKDNRGIILSGNYRGGISVGDCITNAELVANKIKSL